MKRILLAALIGLILGSMAIYADEAWFGSETQHIEQRQVRINGSGTVQRWYKLLPASSVDYDTTASTHEYADLAETSILQKNAPTRKWYDLEARKVTKIVLSAYGTDITSDAGGVNFFLLGSDNGKDQFVVDVDSGIAEGSWYYKDFTIDSTGFPRYLSLAAMVIDTNNAATVVRNQWDVSIKFFGPESQALGKP